MKKKSFSAVILLSILVVTLITGCRNDFEDLNYTDESVYHLFGTQAYRVSIYNKSDTDYDNVTIVVYYSYSQLLDKPSIKV